MRLIFCILMLIPGHLMAQNAETRLSKVKEKLVSQPTNLVTNPELKAEAGSMSRYSMKFSLSYYGAGVGTPFAETYKKANVNSASENKTALSGSLSARYRLNEARTINFGSGLRAVTPFHGVERAELSSPYVSIDEVDRRESLQYRMSAGASMNTNQFYKELGQVGSLSYNYGLKYYLAASRYVLSLEGSLSWFLYDREVDTNIEISNLYVGLYPGLDYRLTDKLTLKTSFSTSLLSLRSKSLDTWKTDIVSQRLGLGASLTPTVFIFPYLNFFPDRFTWGTTTIAMSTTFSIF